MLKNRPIMGHSNQLDQSKECYPLDLKGSVNRDAMMKTILKEAYDLKKANEAQGPKRCHMRPKHPH